MIKYILCKLGLRLKLQIIDYYNNNSTDIIKLTLTELNDESYLFDNVIMDHFHLITIISGLVQSKSNNYFYFMQIFDEQVF